MRKYLLAELVALMVIVLATLVLVKGVANRSAPVTAKSPKSLRTRAQSVGNALASAEPRNLKRYDDLSSLGKESATIVTGTVESNESSLLQPAETLVVTDYLVRVEDVLKGNTPSGKDIIVREPGGHVDFGNGSSADVQMPEYWSQPQTGGKYTLFLKDRRDGTFALVGGPQGLFRLTEGIVTPQLRPNDKLMQTYNGKSEGSFLKGLRNAIKH